MPVKKERLLVTAYRCLRCKAVWLPRKPFDPIDMDDLPVRCAVCKSKYWNTPVTSPGKRTNVKRDK